jgi:hypothetical protein
MLKAAPTFRQHAVESADYLRHFIFRRKTFLNEITQSLAISATSIIQMSWEFSGTRVAIQPCHDWCDGKPMDG